MHERALRTVLLIQAIDESDPEGEVLPLAEREEATRVAAQRAAGTRDGNGHGGALPRSAERLLVARAEYLLPRLAARAPVVAHMLSLARGGSWLAPLMLAIAFASGVSLSALDGSRRIDLLAFPLLALIAWNALVYVVLIVAALRRRGPGAVERAWLPRLYERWLRGRAEALQRRSSRFNQPLSAALSRFARDVSAVARPLLVLRGRRLFHLCAALVALGLIAGLYVRGIVLRYDAGWDSTFLAPGGVRVLLHALYGPASALSGIALPDSLPAIEALRWQGGAAGVPAAPWIHVIALTAVLYIVLPRSAAAVWASAQLFRQARRPTLPASLLPYARAIARQGGGAARLSARVTSYAYEPGPDSLAGLSALLSDALSGEVALERTASVTYGGEDAFAARLHDAAGANAAADCHVLLMSLAATPEAENHGRMLDALRRELAGRQRRSALLVMIDEAPYAARMRGDASFERRMDERRAAWREFVARHGLEACIADLSSVHAGQQVAQAERDGVLTAMQWPAR
jgi:hypothetical protein